MRHKLYGPYERFIKRPLDCILAILAFAFLTPMLAVIAILVRVKFGSPVIFTQERPGKFEKVFKLYKFRTMTEEKDNDGELLPDEMRLTPFGKFLRSTSLDELPELINIIRGDMAFVGPRPLLVRYLERYDEHQLRRQEVRPGLTGLAQINGRNAVSWEERFNFDVEYVDHITFISDIRIIMSTFRIVISKAGIHSETSVTMEEFMGSGSE